MPFFFTRVPLPLPPTLPTRTPSSPKHVFKLCGWSTGGGGGKATAGDWLVAIPSADEAKVANPPPAFPLPLSLRLPPLARSQNWACGHGSRGVVRHIRSPIAHRDECSGGGGTGGGDGGGGKGAHAHRLLGLIAVAGLSSCVYVWVCVIPLKIVRDDETACGTARHGGTEIARCG